MIVYSCQDLIFATKIGSTADAVEQALDEQIRQLLADASTADDVSGAPGVRSKDRSTSETVG